MKLRLLNWKIISLLFILILSFTPYIGALSLKLFFFPDITFHSPIKIFHSEECSKLIGSPCSKGILFKDLAYEKGTVHIPGLTASTPRLSCINNNTITELNSDVFFGSNLSIEEKDTICNGGVIAYFRADLDAAYGSWILPYMITGEKSHVGTLVRSVMFFRSELRTIFAGIVPFQVLLLLFLLSLLGSTIAYRFKYSFFTVSLMALVNGGVIEKAFFLPSNLFSPESKEFLGFLILTTFSFESFKKISTLRNYAGCVLVSALIEYICFAFKLQKDIIWIAVILGWGTLTIFTKFAFQTTTFFILNCFYLLSVLTPYNLIPPYAGTLFFMIYFLGVQVEQIRLRLLNWRINQMSRSVTSMKELESLVKLIARVHHIERLSLSLIKNETFEHLGYTPSSQSAQRLISQLTSNVVSRVYASGRPLIHINAYDDVLGQKLSNKSRDYRSQYFSSFPVKNNGQTWGVISFTDYSKSVLHQDAVGALHGVFLECSEIVAKALSQVTNKFATEFEEIFIESVDKNQDSSLDAVINGTFDVLSKKYAVSAYFSEISEDNTIKLRYASGKLASMLDNINTSSFKVSANNEFGPIALAFKENEPIVLQNWKPIADKISAAAANVYRATNANSIVTIPINIKIAGRVFRYLVWMQTDDQRTFNSDFQRVAKIIQTKMSHVLDKQLNHFMSETVLSLVDSDAIQSVMHGKDTNICEHGELIMFDLCKSTQLSLSLSTPDFQLLSQKYHQISAEKMALLGFKLQMVIGDALLFTKSYNSGTTSREQLINLVYECEDIIKQTANDLSPNSFAQHEPSLRVCSAFGDISRGVIKGTGGGWAITGATINEIHKIESVAKKFRSGIYFELEGQTEEGNLNFVSTDTQAWTGSAIVYYLQFTSEQKTTAA